MGTELLKSIGSMKRKHTRSKKANRPFVAQQTFNNDGQHFYLNPVKKVFSSYKKIKEQR